MRTALTLLMLMLLLVSLPASAKRDPLTADEVQQLRDTAQEPEKRLALYVKFIRARATSLEQTYADPRLAAGRGQQIHELLEDIDSLVQEMDDNIDQYAHQRYDIRKPLKQVIDMDGEVQAKLRAMKQAAPSLQQTANPSDYAFVLDNALDSVTSSLDNARQTSQEQEAAIEAAKKEKKKK